MAQGDAKDSITSCLALAQSADSAMRLTEKRSWQELDGGDHRPAMAGTKDDGMEAVELDGFRGSGVGDGEPGIAAGAEDAAVSYKVYKRRWFGLVQLTLMNIIVSWDVRILWLPLSRGCDLSDRPDRSVELSST